MEEEALLFFDVGTTYHVAGDDGEDHEHGSNEDVRVTHI